MQVNQLSTNSLATSSPYMNPKATETQPAASLQSNQDAQKPVKAAKTDTVTISQQALQMTSSSNNKPEQAKPGTMNQQRQGGFSTRG